MYIVLSIMLTAAAALLFACGYFTAVIKRKYGNSWLMAVPLTVAILMINIIRALMEMSKDGRWGI